MGLLRGFENHEYRPEYGTFLLRDSAPYQQARVPVDPLLAEYALDTSPCGSIARGGDGWLDGRATDAYHAVRLELHDEPPAPDAADWSDVVETPMASGGTVSLSMVTGGAGPDPFRLGEPGLYRVRFARRPAADGDSYRLQFWTVAADPEPPRWIRRDRRLVEPDDGFGHAVSDLASLLLWAGEAATPLTVAGLADRLATTPATVRDIVRHAVRAGVLGDDAVPDDPCAPVLLTVLAREPVHHQGAPIAVASPVVVTPPPVTRFEEARTRRTYPGRAAGGDDRPEASPAAKWRAYVRARPSPAPPLPVGAPPRAGVVGQDGELVVWHDNVPLVLNRWMDAPISRALQCRYGTVLLAATQAALIRPDGGFALLCTGLDGPVALDPTGRRLAVVEAHTGRRSWARLHLLDLADGSRQTMPWKADDPQLAVIAVHGDQVYVRGGRSGDTLLWRPGTAPRPLPWRVRQVDPYTGVLLAGDDAGSLLVYASGATRRLGTDSLVRLAPGATSLCAWTYEPPTLSLFDHRNPARSTVIGLPARSDTGVAPGGPVWEDPRHVLVPARHGRNGAGVPLVRVAIPSGAIEAIALTEATTYRPVLVEPCPRP